MEETSQDIFFNEIAKYPRLNKTEERIEFTKIYLHREILKVAITSDRPKLIDYLRLIRIRDKIINEVDRRYFKNRWAELAQISIEELDRVIKHGRCEWAKLAQVPVIDLNRIQNQGVLARKRIVIHNLYLVVKTANKYQNKGVEILDLIQEGSIGLSRGIDLFNQNKKVEFVKFAQYHIEKEIIEAINKYFEIIGKRSSVIKSQFNSRAERNFLNLVPDLSEEREELALIEALVQTIDELEPREQKVLSLRYSEENQQTLRKTGALMKISKDTVRIIEYDAIKKIQSLFEINN